MFDQESGLHAPDVIASPVDARNAIGGLYGGGEIIEDARLCVKVFKPVPAGEDAVLVVELMVDLGVDAIAVEGVGGRAEEVVDVAAAVSTLIGQRIVFEGVDGNRAQETGGDDVASERVADIAGGAGRAGWVKSRGARVEDLYEAAVLECGLGEVACALELCRYGAGEGADAALSEAFVGGKKEGPVFAIVDFGDDDRATDCAAELVATEGSAGLASAVGIEAIGVEHGVAQEVVERAVQGVGAAAHGEADHAAARAAEFRSIRRSIDLEFLDGVDLRHGRDLVVVSACVGCAVDENLVSGTTAAIDAEVISCGLRCGIDACVEPAGDAWGKCEEQHGVADVERNGLEELILYDGAAVGILHIQKRGSSFYGDGLFDLPGVELQCHGALLAYFEDQFIHFGIAKARGASSELILARSNRREEKDALAICGSRYGEVGGEIAHSNFGFGNGGTGGVQDGAGDDCILSE